MSLITHFKDARLSAMTLAKVGNPLRDEALLTSKSLCRFEDSEADLLTHCFLKSFRALERHRFHHEKALADNEVFARARAVFESDEALLENGAHIARHLHESSRHPNIKSGDLCIGLIDGIKVAGQTTRALSIIKSESKVPFLQISVADGDLKLTTQQGIYPDKIDKGCLIINYDEDGGFVVFVFDKTGGNTHFWNRDFLGVAPVKDENYLTKRYSELCVAFADEGLPEETPAEDRRQLADRAIGHLEETGEFDLGEFKNTVLEDPAVIEQFSTFKSDYEAEQGEPLDERFTVSKKLAERARRRLNSRLKLDVGADIRFSSGLVEKSDDFIEKGFDEQRHMKFVKIYYHQEL